MRELRLADLPRETKLHAMRERADAAVCAVERLGHPAGDHCRELGGGLDVIAEAGGNASAAILVSRMALVGPGKREIRLDAVGGGSVGMGISRVAEGTQEKDRAQGEELVQPEGFDLCLGGGIRAYSAVVAASRATVGQDARGTGAVSRIALRRVVDRDSDRGGGVVPEGGDPGLIAGAWESIDWRKLGNVDDISSVDVVGLGLDVKSVCEPAKWPKMRRRWPQSQRDQSTGKSACATGVFSQTVTPCPDKNRKLLHIR